MTVQTCKACGESKAIEAFERLSSGGHRGTCIACRQEAATARKRAKREAYEATPEYQALIAQREADRLEREAKKQADREAAAKAKAIQLAEQAAQRAAQREAAHLERLEREAALRDDIWSAMNADSDDRAQAFRFDAAQRSDLIARS